MRVERVFFYICKKRKTMKIKRIIPVICLLAAVACGQPKQSENTFGGNESVQSIFGNTPVADGSFASGNFTNPSQQQMPQQQQGFGNNPNMGMQQQMPQQQQGFGNNPNMGMQQQMPQQQQGFGNNPNMGMQQQMPQHQQGFGNNPNMGMQQQNSQQMQGFGNNPNMGMQQQMPQQQQGFGNNPNMGMQQQNSQQMQQQGMVRPMLQQMQAQASAKGAQFQAWTFAGPMCVGLITVTRSQQGMECALEYTDVSYDYEYPLTFMGQNQGWYYFQVPNTQDQVYMDANGTQLYIGNSIVLQACTPEQCDQILIQVAQQRKMMQQGSYGNYGDYDNYQEYSY